MCNGATNCSLSAQKDCGPFPHGNKKKLSGGLHIETHSHPAFFPPCVPELWHQTSNALQETRRNFFEENLTSPKDTNTGVSQGNRPARPPSSGSPVNHSQMNTILSNNLSELRTEQIAKIIRHLRKVLT